MAKIRIKGRDEEIIVDNEKARKIKQRWAGDPANGIARAERGDIVDLGEWSGEYGSIRSIELDHYTSAKTDPAHHEVEKIETEINKFKQERRNGRLVSPTDLYMESLGTIKFDEHGIIIITDPYAYGYISKCLAVIERKKFAQHQELKAFEKMAPMGETSVKKICRKCTNTLPPHLQNYCSGICMQAARDDGSYGREDESEEERKEREERLATLA